MGHVTVDNSHVEGRSQFIFTSEIYCVINYDHWNVIGLLTQHSQVAGG